MTVNYDDVEPRPCEDRCRNYEQYGEMYCTMCLSEHGSSTLVTEIDEEDVL